MNLNYALNLFGINSLENIDESQLKLKYIKLAKIAHPDKSGSHEEFVVLKEAHDILLDIIKQKHNKFPTFLTKQDNSSLTPTNYQVLKDQYELLEDTKDNISTMIVQMQVRKKEIELECVSELKTIESDIENNVWYKLSNTFLNKYPQSYYDKKTKLRIKSQNLKSSIDKQVFKEIISEYSKTMDMLQLNLGRIDSEVN
jgi:curved DNA-binding protein CbpA